MRGKGVKKDILYTVGHSNRTIEEFLSILKSHHIQAIADVRSKPYSRYVPQYNREQLSKRLRQENIYYVFLGKELGAHREEEDSYAIVEGGGIRVDFEKTSQSDIFQEGINRLKVGVNKMLTAIMCAEKDPLECHRTLLVAHYAYLQGAFHDIVHIIDNQTVETRSQLEERLLKKESREIEKANQLLLFERTKQEECLIEMAYKIRSQRMNRTYETIEEQKK